MRYFKELVIILMLLIICNFTFAYWGLGAYDDQTCSDADHGGVAGTILKSNVTPTVGWVGICVGEDEQCGGSYNLSGDCYRSTAKENTHACVCEVSGGRYTGKCIACDDAGAYHRVCTYNSEENWNGTLVGAACCNQNEGYVNNCDSTDKCFDDFGIGVNDRDTGVYNSCALTSDTNCGLETLCDGIDNDCDGLIDEGCPFGYFEELNCGENIKGWTRDSHWPDGNWIISPLPSDVSRTLNVDLYYSSGTVFVPLSSTLWVRVYANKTRAPNDVGSHGFYNNLSSLPTLPIGTYTVGAFGINISNDSIDNNQLIGIHTITIEQESCDGIDNDCDGLIDEGDVCGCYKEEAPNGNVYSLAQTLGTSDPNLISYWNFDSSPNDQKGINNGTITGGVTLQSGLFSNAYQFDGTSGFITVLNNASLNFGTGQFSYCLWYKEDSGLTTGQLLVKRNNNNWEAGKGASYEAQINRSEGMARVYTTNLSGYPLTPESIIPPPQINQWHSLCYVKNTGTYIDGNLVSARDSSALDLSNLNNNLYFGSDRVELVNNGNAEYFKGMIDDISIWNRNLTECEVKKIALGPSACLSDCINICSGAITHLTFDSNDGTTTWDVVDVIGDNDGLPAPNPNHPDFDVDPGIVGDAFMFDRGGAAPTTNADYMTIPNDPTLNVGEDDFAISLWVKGNDMTIDEDATIISKIVGNVGYEIEVEGDGGSEVLRFTAGNPRSGINVPVSSVNVQDEIWHNIIAMRENNELKLYVDKVLYGPVAVSGNVNNASDLIIGREEDPSIDDYYNGVIDELVIWDRALTTEEIEEVFANNFDCGSVTTVGCIGVIDGNAVLISGDDTGVLFDTNRILVDSNSSDKCEYVCKGGYHRVDQTCVPNSIGTCLGGIDSNAVLISGDDIAVLFDTNRVLVDSNSANKCEYICRGGYHRVEQTCVADVNGSCIGNIPSNANLCLNDAIILDEFDVSRSLIGNSETDCTPLKCEYYCKTGFDFNGSACVLSFPGDWACSGSPGSGNGVIVGSNKYYISSYVPKSWTYNSGATGDMNCMWKCDSGYTRYGNGCMLGGIGSDVNNIEFIELSIEDKNIVAKIQCSNNLKNTTFAIMNAQGVDISNGVEFISENGLVVVNGHLDCNTTPTKYVLKSNSFVGNQQYLVTATIPQTCNICSRSGYVFYDGEIPITIPDANLIVAVLVACFVVFIISKKRI